MKNIYNKGINKLFEFIKQKQKYVICIILTFIIWFGVFIRTRNLHLLQKKYLLGGDPYIILRYVNYIVEHGKLFVIDNLRYYPFGYKPIDTKLLSYILAYFYKILHIFSPSLTSTEFLILYPVIILIPLMIVFYLFIKKLTNKYIALVATAFLIVIPSFVYRTSAGFSEKEPLCIFLMILVMYLFIIAFKAKEFKKYLFFIFLSGIFTALLTIIWGGVQYLIVIIPLFIFINYLFNNLTKRNTYVFLIWVLFYIIGIFIKEGIGGGIRHITMTSSLDAIVVMSVFTLLILDLLLENKFLSKIKTKINNYFPYKITLIFVLIILTFILIFMFFGPQLAVNKVVLFKNNIFNPMGPGKFVTTVEEANLTYIKEDFYYWMGIFFYLSLIGSIYLFYKLIKQFKNYKKLLVMYVIFLIGFTFNRYSSGSSYLNGISTVSKFIYIASILLFLISLLITYFKVYYKDKNLTNYKFDKNILFLLVWFIISFFAAKGAFRLIMMFSLIVTPIAAYLLINLININFKKYKSKKQQEQLKDEQIIKKQSQDLMGSINIRDTLK